MPRLLDRRIRGLVRFDPARDLFTDRFRMQPGPFVSGDANCGEIVPSSRKRYSESRRLFSRALADVSGPMIWELPPRLLWLPGGGRKVFVSLYNSHENPLRNSRLTRRMS
jgi:hypothetical protein